MQVFLGKLNFLGFLKKAWLQRLAYNFFLGRFRDLVIFTKVVALITSISTSGQPCSKTLSAPRYPKNTEKMSKFA